MRIIVLLSSLLTLAGATATTTDHVANALPTRGHTVAADIRTFQFAPDTIRVRVGDHVVWTNRDEIEHTVTAGTPETRDAAFDKTLAGKGATYDVAFERSGTFGYFCARHQFMRGTIIVTR